MTRRVDEWMKPFLRNGRKAVVLDGGTGTTLVERGADVTSMFWSAQLFFDPKSPVTTEDMYKLHMDFLKSGADVILTNTYKISDELLKHVPDGMSLKKVSAKDVFREAVNLASRARDDYQNTLPSNEPRRLVCLAMGGLGACIPQQVCAGLSHRGNFAVSDDYFYDFWRKRMSDALSANPEILAFETIPDLRETRVICDVLSELKPAIPVWLCWSCKNETDICCGIHITDVIKITNACTYVTSVGVNCTDSLYIAPLLKILQKYSNKTLVAYPNFGRKWDARVGHRRWVGKEHFYHRDVSDWAEMGASIIGGCCECNPMYLQKISSALNPERCIRVNAKL